VSQSLVKDCLIKYKHQQGINAMVDEMKWEFRVIKVHDEYKSPNDKLSIQECLMDEDGVLVAHSTDYIVDGKDKDEIKDKLTEMETSLDKPILSELRGVDYEDK